MAESSLGFTEGSFFLQLNGLKHLRSVAEDLTNSTQKKNQANISETVKLIFLNRS